MIKAICVGINSFRHFPQASLKGCINDAKTMSNLFSNYFSVDHSNIQIITDMQATKQNIIKSLTDSIKTLNSEKFPGTLLFSMSSHGTQTRDIDGDEITDYLDEAFVCYDTIQSGDDWNRDTIIVDDEFYNLFNILQKRHHVEVFLDTCHSGSGLRALPELNKTVRFIPPPFYIAQPDSTSTNVSNLSKGIGWIHFPPENFSRKVKKPIANLFSEDSRSIFWSACMANQASNDSFIRLSWHGAFTYYFATVLGKSKNLSWNDREEILLETRKYLKTNGYEQIPQLEINGKLID